MAAKNFRKLFEPYTVKSMTLRNRIVMTPIGTNFAEHTGEVNERIIDYYKQRAKGGTGLITIEAASVYSPQGASGSYQLRIDHDNYIPGLYRLCESIHDCGSKISILLNHAGSVANGIPFATEPAWFNKMLILDPQSWMLSHNLYNPGI